MFTLAYGWFFHTHPDSIAKKLGESKEERRRKLHAFLGRPHPPRLEGTRILELLTSTVSSSAFPMHSTTYRLSGTSKNTQKHL